MNSADHRKNALLGYVATIAFDPRVSSARSADALYDAVMACLKEDLPSIARDVLKGGARMLARKIAAKGEPMLERAVESVFDGIAAMLGGDKRR